MPRVARTVGLAFGLFGGLIASQGPEFAQQYRQRIGGAVDELRRVVERFDSDARLAGHTRDAALQQLQGSADGLTRAQGGAMGAHVARLERLDRHRRDLAAAGPIQRAYILAVDGDPALLRAAYLDYEPAIPTTTGGLVIAAIGFGAGYALSRLIGIPLRRLLLRRRATPRPAS